MIRTRKIISITLCLCLLSESAKAYIADGIPNRNNLFDIRHPISISRSIDFQEQALVNTAIFQHFSVSPKQAAAVIMMVVAGVAVLNHLSGAAPQIVGSHRALQAGMNGIGFGTYIAVKIASKNGSNGFSSRSTYLKNQFVDNAIDQVLSLGLSSPLGPDELPKFGRRRLAQKIDDLLLKLLNSDFDRRMARRLLLQRMSVDHQAGEVRLRSRPSSDDHATPGEAPPAQAPVTRWLLEGKLGLGPRQQAVFTAILEFFVFALPLAGMAIMATHLDVSTPQLILDMVAAGLLSTIIFFRLHRIPVGPYGPVDIPWRMGTLLGAAYTCAALGGLAGVMGISNGWWLAGGLVMGAGLDHASFDYRAIRDRMNGSNPQIMPVGFYRRSLRERLRIAAMTIIGWLEEHPAGIHLSSFNLSTSIHPTSEQIALLQLSNRRLGGRLARILRDVRRQVRNTALEDLVVQLRNRIPPDQLRAYPDFLAFLQNQCGALGPDIDQSFGNYIENHNLENTLERYHDLLWLWEVTARLTRYRTSRESGAGAMEVCDLMWSST